jgi:hypothetical protein
MNFAIAKNGEAEAAVPPLPTPAEAQAALDVRMGGETKVKAKKRQMPVWIVPLVSIIPVGGRQ